MATPSSESSRAVPPVDTISTPSSASPRANSTSPRLSETESRARRTLTSPMATGPTPLAVVFILDPRDAWIVGVEGDAPSRDQAHGTRQQAMLDLVHPALHFIHRRRIGELERLLEDDRPAVHPLVHEVHGGSGELDPVVERRLDRPNARERGQERRVDVHDPALEAADEARAEYLHEAREHDELHAPLLEPVAERAVALVPV